MIYPVVFVWRTGFWDTISAVLRRALAERQHDSTVSAHSDFMLDRLDDGLEPTAREEGGKLQWDDIKRTAQQATALADGGVRLTLDRVARLVQRDPSVEVHLVAHSAGAILLAPAVQLLTSRGRITSGPMKGRKGLGVTVHSCTLWAPACTTDLFHAAYFDAIEERRIREFLMITLTEQAEAGDNVAGIYRKSLLHLVSSALEEEPRVPDDSDGTEIMGMARFVIPEADRPGYPEFMRLARRKSVTWMFSPAPMIAESKEDRPVAARRHGDLDDDPGTLLATLSVILNRPLKDIRLALHRSASSAKKFRMSLYAATYCAVSPGSSFSTSIPVPLRCCFQLIGCAGEQRERAVVHRHHLLHAQPLRRHGRGVGPHREAIADRQKRDVGFVELADQFHVAEQRGIARVVNRLVVLEFHDEAGGLTEIDDAVLVDAAAVARIGHGDAQAFAGDRAALVHRLDVLHALGAEPRGDLPDADHGGAGLPWPSPRHR